MQELLVYKNGDKEFKIQVSDDSLSPVTYQVIPKYDADAPDGFQKARTTKILDPDVNNVTPLAFFDGDRKVYDTGLSKNSKALKRVYPDDANLQTALQLINKLIVKPFTSDRPLETIEPSNVEFWDDFNIKLGVDLSFNTSDPMQLFQLYCLVLHGKLAPTGLESEPYFKNSSQYAVENKDTVVDVSQKREFEKNKAVSRFINLLDTDKEALSAILEWMGIPGLADADDAMMNTVFTHWLSKDDNQNPKEFLDVYKNYYESESGKKQLQIFKGLKTLERKKFVKRGIAGNILFEDEVIGKNMKEATANVLKDTQLLDKIYAKIDA